MERDDFIQAVLREGRTVPGGNSRQRRIGEYTIEITSQKAIMVTLNGAIIHYSCGQGGMIMGDKTLPQIARDLPIFFNP